MRTSAFLDNPSSTGTAKSFNGKVIALFHFRLVSIGSVELDDRDSLASVDIVPSDRVPTKIGDGLDCQGQPCVEMRKGKGRLTLMGLASDFYLVALHDFLDRFSDITHTDIEPGSLGVSVARVRTDEVTYPDSSVGCVLDSFQ